jgi:hypothetical protein
MMYEHEGFKWKYNDPCMYDNGKPMHKYLGPCPECGRPCFDYGGGWRCTGAYCQNSSTNPIGNLGPAPSWWNTDIKIGKDGNMFTAFWSDFINLQESNCGFGVVPHLAVDDLFNQE